MLTAYQILSVDFYSQGALHTAITDAVYCVKLVVSDRRAANKVNFILDNLLDKSYNTTPAEEKKALEMGDASLLSKACIYLIIIFKCVISYLRKKYSHFALAHFFASIVRI